MLFGRNGQNLTIIERFVINDDHQVGINQMRQLNVTSIDANYHLYTVDTVGPLIVGYNHWLEDFTRDRECCRRTPAMPRKNTGIAASGSTWPPTGTTIATAAHGALVSGDCRLPV